MQSESSTALSMAKLLENMADDNNNHESGNYAEFPVGNAGSVTASSSLGDSQTALSLMRLFHRLDKIEQKQNRLNKQLENPCGGGHQNEKIKTPFSPEASAHDKYAKVVDCDDEEAT